jgi:hypothetical protein
MAESVKRRVAAARLAVAFVAAGTIAGASAWASASPQPRSEDNILVSSTKGVKVQVPTFKMYEKLSDNFSRFKKAENTYKAQIKGELNGINGDIGTIKGELGGYIKTTEADSRYIKMNDAIMGDGSVFTATQALSKGSPDVSLATVPGQLQVDATDQEFTITNVSGGTLTHSSCTAGVPGGTLAPGGTLTCATGNQAETLQFVNGDGHVITLNFSNVALPNGSQATVQILVGL